MMRSKYSLKLRMHLNNVPGNAGGAIPPHLRSIRFYASSLFRHDVS
jgi:hypothetical protein